MYVYEAIADGLRRGGVKAIFTLMGEETAKLIVEAARRGISVYNTRHEAGAVGMADGYARVSGSVGVAVVSRGPGLTNGLTPLICASRAGSRVVVIAAASESRLTDLPQEEATASDASHKHVEQERLLSAAMVHSTTLRWPDSAGADMSAALDRAGLGTTLVVNVPADVMGAMAGTQPARAELPPPPTSVAPQPSDIELLADLLEATWVARRPVILAGRGTLRSNAREELIRLGDQIGALLGTSLLAKSLFAGETYNIGVVGSFSTPVALEMLQAADLLLVFGTSMNPMTTYRGEIFPKAKIVQVDSNVNALGRFLEPHVKIVGDARLTARAVADALDRRAHRATGYRTPDTAQRIAQAQVREIRDQGRPGALDPRLVMVELEKVLPERRTLVVDSGHQFSFPSSYLSVHDAGSYLFPHDGGALGGALSAALGAAVAAPDRLTVLCVGDGGLMMSLAELDTATRYGLPLLIVVSNNSSFASEVYALRAAGYPEEAAHYTNPSFEALASALGAAGRTVRTLDELRELRDSIENLRGPLLIDCKVGLEVRADWADFVYGAGVSGDWGRPAGSAATH